LSLSVFFYLLLLLLLLLRETGKLLVDRDHEHCKPKGEEFEEKQRSMSKKIRGGAKERNVRGRKALRAASN
jgi:hypothetical protein